MSSIIKYTTAQTDQELTQILDLQKINLPKSISLEESQSQGFVTVKHNFDLLKEMNDAAPHIIAKAEDQVVGYALVMLEQFKIKIPVLQPMFQHINQLNWKGKKINELQYFVMGQVCIAKNWRGRGLFSNLYKQMKKTMENDFDAVITEVATRNTRSMRAHEKVGFEVIDIYKDDKEEWAVVGWNW